MPGQHPDDDLLADLAADVLPLDQARAVEAHVLACDRCAGLLSDAERVRSLLLADDAGPVPPEVWNRIEAALRTAAPASPAESPQAPLRPAPEGRVDATGRTGWEGPDPLDQPEDWSTSLQPAVPGTPRAGVHPPQDARIPGAGNLRRLTTSRRDARLDRRRPPTPALIGAAAVIVLLLAAGAVRALQSGGGTTAASGDAGVRSAAGASSSAAAAGSAATAVITRSNVDYTSATLAQRARSLVAAATRIPAQGGGTAGSVPTGAATAKAVPGTARTSMGLASVSPDPSATDVTNPRRLAACLTALGAPADPVVAVDLARYQGREAAVLVLRTEGGYEVWVVERTCRPGQEGALAETTLAG
jgi:hypothetical protein